jgi:hypothetical protein
VLTKIDIWTGNKCTRRNDHPIPVAPTNDQAPAPNGPFMTRQSLFSGAPRQIRGGPKNYVVNKNNHYIFVDGPIFSLHDADVSPIGSPGKDVLNPLGKPSSSSRMWAAHKAD